MKFWALICALCLAVPVWAEEPTAPAPPATPPPPAAPQPPAPKAQAEPRGSEPSHLGASDTDRERERAERERDRVERERQRVERERQRVERERERALERAARELEHTHREQVRAFEHAQRDMDRERLRADAIQAVFAKRRGYLGLVVLEIGAKLRAHYGAPADAGVLVSDVVTDGPAQRAGVAVGDVLVSIGGTKVTSSADVRHLVADTKEGTEVKLGVLRAGKAVTVTAKVIEREMPQVMLDAFPGPGCVPSLDPDAIRELVERKIELRRTESPERLDDLERRLKELQDRLQKLQEKLQGNNGSVIPSGFAA